MSDVLLTVAEHCECTDRRGRLSCADRVGVGSFYGTAPFVTLYLRTQAGIVTEAAFEAAGCGVTVACGSALSELVIGRTVGACRSISADDVRKAIAEFPMHKAYCAEVAVNALRAAVGSPGEIEPNQAPG